jgi:pimeloyl-ACP methyl ester carboxylesterase
MDFEHQRIIVERLSIHVVEAGREENPAVLLLHGWPEDWSAYAPLMGALSQQARVVAIDLPGIGGSETPPPSNDKRSLVKIVHGVIGELGLRKVTLVGHDVGGQIVYAYLHSYPQELAHAVMLDIAVPGVDPWEDVKRNPYIWHFAFHAIRGLPEMLVTGHEASYFDYFYDAISARQGGVSARSREAYVHAYARPEALHTGFEWYRAFPQDEKDNVSVKNEVVETPVLYLRGDHQQGDMEEYLMGFRAGGLRDIHGQLIPNSGHYTLDEQPDGVLTALRSFLV